MCLSHACRISPSSTAVLLLKKKERKITQLLQKKQTLLNLVTVDAWQVPITMARCDVSLDLFPGLFVNKGEGFSRISASTRNKNKNKVCCYALKVKKSSQVVMAYWFDLWWVKAPLWTGYAFYILIFSPICFKSLLCR